MILDTGAGLAVNPEVAQEAGLKSRGSGMTGGVGEKSVEYKLTYVHELSFGPVRLHDLDCTIISTADSGAVFGKVRVDG